MPLAFARPSKRATAPEPPAAREATRRACGRMMLPVVTVFAFFAPFFLGSDGASKVGVTVGIKEGKNRSRGDRHTTVFDALTCNDVA